MGVRYWICYLGYALSFLLGMFAIMAGAFAPMPYRIPAGMAAFLFGWGGKVFHGRLEGEFYRHYPARQVGIEGEG